MIEPRAAALEQAARTEARPRLRALVVEDGTPGGIQRAVEYLVDGWAGAPDGPEVTRLELRGDGSLLSSVPRYVAALARLGAMLVRGRPDLLHLNLTQRGSTYRAMPVVALARVARVPVLIHLHSSEYRSFVASLPAPLLALVRWTFRSAATVAVLGEGWATFARDTLRVPARAVEVVPNAVPGPASLPAGREPGPVRLLFLGRVGRRKGADDLLHALAGPRLRGLDWEATFAGDGEVDAHRALAEQIGIGSRVRFTGWVEQPEVRRELARADVMVLPSHAEGLPLSVLEGLANGLAVIATPVGAVPEVIREGETGLLVPPGQPSELAAAIERVLLDEALRRRLGERGRALWEREHDVRAYVGRMSEIYRRTARLAR